MAGSTMGKYSKYFTLQAGLRQPSAMRALQKLLSRPDNINLGGGLPNPKTFPIKGISINLFDGTEISLRNVEQALQYSNTKGMPALLTHLKQFQVHEHGSNATHSDICVSTGSQGILTKSFELFLEKDDSLLLEEFTYSGSLAFLKPYGCNLVPIKVDNEGLVPSDLNSVMETWDLRTETSGHKKPKLLYIIPTGANPTGKTLSLARRKELLDVARQHDLLILEDDPYYYLQFKEQRIPSLFSLDTDGRVVRFDSFSKILSSGLRIGFVTGPPEIVDRLELHMQATSLHPSGVSQAIVSTIFDHWAVMNNGDATTGFENHVIMLRKFYDAQCEIFLECANRHLSGLCRWEVPTAGLFVWVEILGKGDRPPGSFAVSQKLIEQQNVLVVAGIHFHPLGKDNQFIRMSFSTSTKAQIDEALSRFAILLREKQT